MLATKPFGVGSIQGSVWPSNTLANYAFEHDEIAAHQGLLAVPSTPPTVSSTLRGPNVRSARPLADALP